MKIIRVTLLLLAISAFGCEKNEIVSFVDNQVEYKTNHANSYDTISINKIDYIVHNPYKNAGKLNLKGAMHVHTDNSKSIDGYGSGDPRWVAEKLRDEGNFDFYTFTDHNYITLDPQVNEIVWMGLSVEDTKGPQHICAYNLPMNTFVNKGEDLFELLNYYKSIGAFASIAHPNWKPTYLKDEVANKITNLHFMEVLNPNDAGGHRSLDILRSNGIITFSMGVDDFHYQESWANPNRYFNKSWIIAFAEKKEKESIWKSLLNGAFYVSNGPDIEVSFKMGAFNVKSSEKSNISFITYSKSGVKDTTDNQNVFESNYNWSNNIEWIRAEVTSNKGVAFTQNIQLIKTIHKK